MSEQIEWRTPAQKVAQKAYAEAMERYCRGKIEVGEVKKLWPAVEKADREAGTRHAD